MFDLLVLLGRAPPRRESRNHILETSSSNTHDDQSDREAGDCATRVIDDGRDGRDDEDRVTDQSNGN